MLGTLAIVLAVVAAVSADCVPENPNVYWKTPCEGQQFENRLKVTDFKISQNGKEVDDAGGFDLSSDVVFEVKFENTYGAIKKPLYDVSIRVFNRIIPLLGKCQWTDVPTPGFGQNMDTCKITKHCHLKKKQTSLTIKLNPKEIAGPLVTSLISVGDYYSVAVTYKDGQTPVACLYGQGKVIKK